MYLRSGEVYIFIGGGLWLIFSPVGDKLTLDFAEALIDAADMGKDDTTDYLSISFSSTDYVGHVFGPSSLEMEDNLLRLGSHPG